jgi:uncharacterized RDD family membrane protein YckC
MNRPWPDRAKYQEVLQYPDIAFADHEIQLCTVEKQPDLDFPLPYSGSFTTTYHLYGKDREWAVRCFVKPIPDDLKIRYRYIGEFFSILNSKARSYFVDARYQDPGVVVNGIWYPVIKMEWVRGKNLDSFIQETIREKGPDGSRSTIGLLKSNFTDLVNTLKITGLAHGDLQHGNIRVDENGRLYLIDYDGMFVPDLKHLKSKEMGHKNYQHIDRRDHFDERLDRFSAIVLYLSFLALESDPTLWEKYNDNEKILFSQADFIDPSASSLINDLQSNPALAQFIERFIAVCLLDYKDIPSLKDFIDGNVARPPRASWRSLPSSQFFSGVRSGSSAVSSRSGGSGIYRDAKETISSDVVTKMDTIYGTPSASPTSRQPDPAPSSPPASRERPGSAMAPNAPVAVGNDTSVKAEVTSDSKQIHLWRELCAEVVDLSFIAFGVFIILLIGTVSGLYKPGSDAPLMHIIFVVAFVLVYVLYHALQEASFLEATIGMSIVGNIAVSGSHRQLAPGQAFQRAFLKALSIICMGIPFLVMLLPDYRAGFHNILAGTQVIADETAFKG